jgi:hypothetical protein
VAELSSENRLTGFALAGLGPAIHAFENDD